MLTNAERAPHETKPIGRVLIDEGLIEPGQLQEALELQQTRGGKTVELLIDLGYLDVDTVSSFLASRPGVASIELEHYTVPRDLCTLIPRDFAIEHEVFPVDRMGNRFTVAMAFPIDVRAIRRLAEMTQLNVSAVLCHAEDIRRAIQHYYSASHDERGPAAPAQDAPPPQPMIAAGLRMENIAQLIRRIDSLPTLPQTVQRVQEAMDDPDTSLRDIAEIVSSDPPIAAKLLQLANSAAYGFLSRINSVQSAITLLGMRETYMAVLSSAVLDLTDKAGHFDHMHYWRTSMFCAAAARKIATTCGEGRNPSVFTAGLLCDIGRFALAEVAPARYGAIGRDLGDRELAEAEEEALGIGHPEAGYVLAVHWKLPEDIAEAIRFHHRPDLAGEHTKLTAIVALAALMTDAHFAHRDADESIFEPYADTLAVLELDAARAADIYAAARSPEMCEATREG